MKKVSLKRLLLRTVVEQSDILTLLLSYMMRDNNGEGTVDYFPLVITCHRDFVGRPHRRRQLGIPSRIQEDDIKMDLQDVGWGDGLD